MSRVAERQALETIATLLPAGYTKVIPFSTTKATSFEYGGVTVKLSKLRLNEALNCYMFDLAWGSTDKLYGLPVRAGLDILRQFKTPLPNLYAMNTEFPGEEIDSWRNMEFFIIDVSVLESTSDAATSASTAKAQTSSATVLTTDVSSSYVLNLTSATEFNLTLTANTCVLAIVNQNKDPSVAQEISVTLHQGTGSNFVKWPSNVKWANGYTPRLSYEKDELDVFKLTSLDGGLTWIALYVASGVK